ncbi:lysin A [Arthrobacter phage Sporto]|nr:lysin A [Arthrobacter phage Sporto]
MTFSPLISGTIPNNGKYSSRQGRPVLKVVQHHWAGTGGGIERMTGPDQASCTYVIQSDGKILGHVPEEFRPWTSGSFEADGDAITIEVQNTTGQTNGNDNDPASWQISNAAYASIINLVADIARRYGWGGIAQGNYRGHREFSSTACPGGFLWARMDNTRAQALSVFQGGAAPVPAPVAPPTAGKTVWQLADEVLAGLHGSGDARKASLGAQYDAVQAEVNRRFGVGAAVPKVKTVSQLADEVLAGKHGNGDARRAALGSQYDAVQNEINRRVGGGGVAPTGVNIADLADRTIRGEYGSGDARVRALGTHYAAVQAEVNRRLGGGVAAAPSPRATITDLAHAVIRGEYGSGADRKARLGANYAAVQAEVNRLLK